MNSRDGLWNVKHTQESILETTCTQRSRTSTLHRLYFGLET
jgi:hypothetical protein